MPRPRKIHCHNTVLFLTMSVEEGLLLLCNPLVEILLKSALARAQALHPVTICHFLFEATHVHFLLVVNNPDDVRGFAERFKTESAHYINRLLGRNKRTVWCKGYDSPVLLTEEDVIDKIVYIYTNPAKDALEESIGEYPGLSSWKMFAGNDREHSWNWIHRTAVPNINNKRLSLKEYGLIAGGIRAKANECQTFRIEPNAWMKCMDMDVASNKAVINSEICRRIVGKEEEYRRNRRAAGKGVIGKAALLREQLEPNHRPDRSGRRSWCISSNRELRRSFISYIKELIQKAWDVYQRWRLGDFSLAFPPGLYPPAMPKLVEPLAFW